MDRFTSSTYWSYPSLDSSLSPPPLAFPGLSYFLCFILWLIILPLFPAHPTYFFQSLSRVWLFVTLDCSLKGSSVHGLFQTRILGRVAMCSSRGSSRPRDWTHVSCVSALACGVFTGREPLPLDDLKARCADPVGAGLQLPQLHALWAL